ncbi:MAG: hypothetical protein LBK99_22940 [Opitutaceae bacterium]|jgi:hypothetical protein|nr:hypothetical protein [Opitutaceae bacterium]
MKTTDKNIHIRLALIALASLALAALPARAVIIASDTFSITENRKTGSAVKGSTTETGTLVWNGSDGWILTGDETNGYATRSSSGTSSLALPFNFGTYSSSGDVATIEIRMKAAGGTGDRTFGIAFGNSATGGNPTTNALVRLRIDPNGGTWALTSKNSGLTAQDNSPLSGSLADVLGSAYSATTFYTYSISYNQSTLTVTDVSINGTSVVSNYVFAASPGNVTAVSFFGQYPNSSTQIDSFTLSVNATPPPVPEPAATALVTALGVFGAIGILRLRLRNRH